MKILWFTNTPSNASEEFDYKAFGGGWISALESLIAKTKKYELGICFYYNGGNIKKIIKNNVYFFGIPLQTGSAFKRIVSRHLSKLNDENPDYFNEIINEFKPDIIHVFGTESGFGKVLMNRSEKIVFNLQGLIGPITKVYFPPALSKFNILIKSDLDIIIRGLTSVHKYRMFNKMAVRERMIIKYYKYFIGRTEWDRNYIKLFNPGAKYFHCEEMLRDLFFNNEWVQPYPISDKSEIVIGTTISPHPFKGLNLIYNVQNILSNFNIRWKIFGIEQDDTLNKIIRRKMVANRNVQNINFYGQINSRELIKQLLTCHFFVHPSYMDNSSNSVCEAMLLGMPVLASCVGGIKSLVINDVTGFMFNPYDKYDLAGLLGHLIRNYDKAKNAGKNAREAAIIRHSPEKIISVLGDIYSFIYNDN